MKTHRTIIAAAAMFTVLAAPALAQTQPPGGTNHLVTICVYDSNEGAIFIRNVQPDQAPVDRGVASPGHPVLAENGQCLQAQETPVPTSTATPLPGPAGQATPTATAVPVDSTATPLPTAEPTATATVEPTPEPEATATPTPFNPEPWPTGTIGPSK